MFRKPKPAPAKPKSAYAHFMRSEVLVTDIDKKSGWRGLLVDTYRDGIVLDAVVAVEQGPGQRVSREETPGRVLIPAGRILMVQEVTP